MKIRLQQMKVTPGFVEANAQLMLSHIEQAKQDAVDLVIFPEMALPGYLLGDEWERPAFLKECEYWQEQLRLSSADISFIFGSVGIDWSKKNEDGRVRKYNALFMAEDGAWLKPKTSGYDFCIKTLMPNYREFDDNRHFYDPRKLAYELKIDIEDLIEPLDSKLGRIGGFLCEDGWDDDYNLSPLKILAQKNCDLFVNISSSPFTYHKNNKRNRVFSQQAKRYAKPLIYVNNCGIQDNAKTLFTFDGASCVYSPEGERLDSALPFAEQHIDIQLDQHKCQSLSLSPVVNHAEDDISRLFEALQYGSQNFMAKLGIKKVVVGVSGGIDSALAAAVYRSFLKPEQVTLVSMPGPFTSQTTRELSRDLAENLDCPFCEIPIAPSVDVSLEQLRQAQFQRASGANHKLDVTDFVKENIQARDRSSRILAAVAAASGAVFTCNANKSEMTVGYSTLYGDLGGFLANLADLWKGEVYQMAHFLNREIYAGKGIPQGSIDIVPSAELSAQHNVDLNQGDPLYYPYHDRLFKSWVEFWDRACPEDILNWYCNKELEQRLGLDFKIESIFDSGSSFIKDLERWWNLYQGMAVAKRIQAPPVLALKRRAFGFDHREAQLGPRYTQGYLKLKQQVLAAEP